MVSGLFIWMSTFITETGISLIVLVLGAVIILNYLKVSKDSEGDVMSKGNETNKV